MSYDNWKLAGPDYIDPLIPECSICRTEESVNYDELYEDPLCRFCLPVRNNLTVAFDELDAALIATEKGIDDHDEKVIDKAKTSIKAALAALEAID